MIVRDDGHTGVFDEGRVGNTDDIPVGGCRRKIFGDLVVLLGTANVGHLLEELLEDGVGRKVHRDVRGSDSDVGTVGGTETGGNIT